MTLMLPCPRTDATPAPLRPAVWPPDDAGGDLALLSTLLRPTLGRDADDVAQRLLGICGCLGSVLHAGPLRLGRVEGMTEDAVAQLGAIVTTVAQLARVGIDRRDPIGSWAALIAYCRVSMAHRSREGFRVLFLDRRNGLIADEMMAEGSLDHVPVYPRELIRRALELNAGALILVHNHPSGDPTPSPEDIALTRQIGEAAALFGIVLHDHVVVARRGEVSFRAEGHLDNA